MAFGPDSVEEFEPTSARELKNLHASHPVLWIDVDGIADPETVRKVGETFELHPLALEDATHLGQRPKSEDFDGHLYAVLQTPVFDEQLEFKQVSIFLGRDYVVTFQEKDEDCLSPVRERIRQGKGRIRRSKADYLAYSIVDTIVDTYFPALERYGRMLDDLETEVINHGNSGTNSEIHCIRQELSGLRSPLWALRETLGGLARNEGEHFAEDTQVFLRDCLDHTSQLMDIVESCREMSVSLMDFHLANMSHRMNEVMKVLTMIATLFIPLSFIAGVYGMNFDRGSAWNMPELGWTFGYPFAIGIMAATTIGFLTYFRGKGWLGRGG